MWNNEENMKSEEGHEGMELKKIQVNRIKTDQQAE